jgi:O6-methylguanine-DNA--protein-cysteine methyltransferase
MLGRNPNPVKVPYLRIVISNGKMGRYIHGLLKGKNY